MKWDTFYEDVKNRMVIESQYLHLLYGNKAQVELQLSRWLKQGKIHRLKRGIYILAEKYRGVPIFEPYVAGILKSPSYISLEKALEMHHLIPDVVYTYTSVTTRRRPVEFVTGTGRFKYTVIKNQYFWGYRSIAHGSYTGFLAEPEKALIDLFYYKKSNIDEAYIESLRLQNTEQINGSKLLEYAGKMEIPFITDAVQLLLKIIEEERQGELA